MFFDTHAHFYPYTSSLDHMAQMTRAQQANVTQIIAVGGSAELNAGALALHTAFPNQVHLALGFDRDQAQETDCETLLATLRLLMAQQPVCAIGETGLDFHYSPDSAEVQCALFAAQLRLADEEQRPIIIHTREADDATLRVLDETPWHGKNLRGVVHCFTGNRDFAARLLDRQLAISFSGIVTFRNADMLRESAAFVPADRLLIETDSPFLAPVPLRGQKNEPSFIPHVAACLAQVRNTSIEAIAEVTRHNAEALFLARK